MKTNIFSAFVFICATALFFIMKNIYIEDCFFDVPDIEIIERIKNINDIEHLKSVAEGHVVLQAHAAETYNKMLVNSVDIFIALSFLAAMLSLFAIIEEKKKIKHSNQQLHEERKKRAL